MLGFRVLRLGLVLGFRGLGLVVRGLGLGLRGAGRGRPLGVDPRTSTLDLGHALHPGSTEYCPEMHSC